MSPEEFRIAAHQAVDWIADFLRDAAHYPVLPAAQPGALSARLPAHGPEHGEPIEAILEDFRRLIVPGLTHWNHPRFFAWFANSASGPGILGEMLAAALNVNHMLWKSSPAATELEQATLGWVREWIGLPPEFFGIIHDTASTATLHAILGARQVHSPETRRTGEKPPLVLYCSEHAHSSVDRGALALGIGLANIRHVPGDGEFRMRPDALEGAIRADLDAGMKPFCVVATVGTTSTSSADPLRPVARIARRHGLWLHVDAAYAGPAAILEEYRHILDGASEADSLVLNPHKWLVTPMDLSILFTRRPEAIREALALAEVPPYLAGSGAGREVNLAEYSIALGRRFRSLKLWFVLRYYGREGLARVLRGHIRMAQNLAAEIAQDARFELSAPAPFSLVCFRYRGSDDENRVIVEKLNHSGFAFLSTTELGGKLVLRLAIGNLATRWEDVLQTWERIRRLAPAADPGTAEAQDSPRPPASRSPR
jgi:aromatic-L-amino-acid decarboxylase